MRNPESLGGVLSCEEIVLAWIESVPPANDSLSNMDSADPGTGKPDA